MGKYQKICFFDVDGTLTDEQGGAEIVIPESAIKALHQAREAGVLLYVNTGRPYGTVPAAIKALPMDGFVCGCGTWILHHGEELMRHVIDQEERIRIMHKVNELNISCVYEAKEGFAVVDPLNHELVNSIRNTYLKDGFTQLEVNDDLVFEKFCFFIHPGDQWPDMSFLENYDKIYRFGCFCEIVPYPCSKGKAIEYLVDYLNLDKKNVYGFGDSENDVEMLKTAYHSIVMGNADDEVKKLATYVTKKASENGLYEAMNHFGLLCGGENDEK